MTAPIETKSTPKESRRRARRRSEEGPALGSDPFEESSATFDPFEEALSLIDQSAPPSPAPAGQWRRVELQSVPAPSAEPQAAEPAKPERPAEPTPLVRPTRPLTPRTSEVELPDDTSWLERLIDPEERRHVAALMHLAESETGYDRFGLSPRVLRSAFPALYALYRLYFRVDSVGHEHIPLDGPVVMASNHAGLLPFDGAMICVDTVLGTDPPRLPRAVVDRWAGALPWVNVFYARVGQVIGTRENVADLLDNDQLLLVFPEGRHGVMKTVDQRYQLQRFNVGFVEQALIARAPVVPVAVLGSDDQTPILFDLEPIAKALGLPTFPITPTFPWLGPLGLLPYPVKYQIVYGEPLCFQEQYGPEDAEDPQLVRYLAGQVRERVQHLLDEHR